MTYEVRLAQRALAHLRHTYQSIRVESSPVAEDWFRGLEAAIFSLGINPHRIPRTPERPDLRHLLYGNKPHRCRIIFSIDDSRQIVTEIKSAIGLEAQ